MTVVLAVAAVVTVGILLLRNPSGSSADDVTARAPDTASCGATLKVVTASSFAPVLDGLSSALDTGDPCVAVQVEVVDGRSASAKVAEFGAHVWIPDDGAWAGVADDGLLAEPDASGSGAVLATSPIYMIADQATADRVEEAGGTWLGLADLVASGSGVRLAVRDPAGSGDGLIARAPWAKPVWASEAGRVAEPYVGAARIRPSQDPTQPFPMQGSRIGPICVLNLLAARRRRRRSRARVRGSCREPTIALI